MTLVRSVLFNGVVFAWTFLLMVAYIPFLVLPRPAVLAAIRSWVGGIFCFQRRLLRLDFEFRGVDNLPDGPFIIASAHQSAWDTVAFYAVLPDPGFVLKHELYRIPMFAPYARRLGMIAINRSGGAGEARRMIRDVQTCLESGRPVVFFPGGTR
jgi:1-acyl-sn-glycerol-3-phosphate acyltransferase